jgi:hypothetical protein
MMPMCLIFSPDKSKKLFERADYFLLVKKATSGSSFFALQKRQH